MLITVIIPVYNSEQYLRACIDSVLEQSYTDFELLLINDGSTDASGNICDEYALKDARVKVFHKQNGGVSSARNLGLEEAKGEWITFVDSDDTIRKDALEVLVKETEKGINDGIMFGYVKNNERGEVVYEFENKGNTIYLSKTDALKYMYKSKHYPYQGYVWSKLFKNEIVRTHKLRFNEKIYFNEDRLFCFEYFSKIKGNIAYILEDLYHYSENPDSAMNQLKKAYNPKFITDLESLIIMKKSIRFYDKELKKFSRNAIIDSILWNIGMMNTFNVESTNTKKTLKKAIIKNLNLDYYFENKTKFKSCLYYLIFK